MMKCASSSTREISSLCAARYEYKGGREEGKEGGKEGEVA